MTTTIPIRTIMITSASTDTTITTTTVMATGLAYGELSTVYSISTVDPIIGFLIGIAILFITRDATVTMWYRLMDAVDPKLVDSIEYAAGHVAGVQHIGGVRVRWLGHRLQAEMHITVDEDLPTRESHRIAEDVRHALFHEQPQLSSVSVHVDPCGHGGTDPHAALAHHEQKSGLRQSSVATA